MTRYYNENPQVTYWREKAERQELLINEYDILCIKHDYLIKRVYGIGGFYEQIKLFEELPWYKKMFFKFKL